MAKLKYRSEIAEAVHSNVAGMYRAGTIDKATLRRFDESCLVAPPVLAPARIKRIRKAQSVTQAIFANYLNTSKSTVEKWETGAKKPSGTALKLLTIVDKHGLKLLA